MPVGDVDWGDDPLELPVDWDMVDRQAAAKRQKLMPTSGQHAVVPDQQVHLRQVDGARVMP